MTLSLSWCRLKSLKFAHNFCQKGIARISSRGGVILSYPRYLLVVHGVFGESDNFLDEQRAGVGGGGSNRK